VPREEPERSRGQANELVTGSWEWCKEGYEIRDGVVRARSSVFECYDPWTKFLAHRDEPMGGGGGRKSDLPEGPYTDLVRLARLPTGEDGDLPEKTASAITDFHNRHGPLGLLSQQTTHAQIYPKWDHVPADFELKDGSIPSRYELVQPIFTRHGGRWQQSQRLLESERHQGGQFEVEVFVIMTELGESEVSTIGPQIGWRPYFPDIPDDQRQSYDYPCPNSRTFWVQSGEPVQEVLKVARMFERILKGLRTSRKRLPGWGRQTLEALMAPASQVVTQGPDGALRTGWQAPSLVSVFAQMIVYDLAGEARIRTCPYCRVPFPSRRSIYCTTKHQNAFRQKRHREKVKEARRLYAEGVSVDEIAAHPKFDGTSPTTIAGWVKPKKRDH